MVGVMTLLSTYKRLIEVKNVIVPITLYDSISQLKTHIKSLHAFVMRYERIYFC